MNRIYNLHALTLFNAIKNNFKVKINKIGFMMGYKNV